MSRSRTAVLAALVVAGLVAFVVLHVVGVLPPG